MQGSELGEKIWVDDDIEQSSLGEWQNKESVQRTTYISLFDKEICVWYQTCLRIFHGRDEKEFEATMHSYLSRQSSKAPCAIACFFEEHSLQKRTRSLIVH